MGRRMVRRACPRRPGSSWFLDRGAALGSLGPWTVGSLRTFSRRRRTGNGLGLGLGHSIPLHRAPNCGGPWTRRVSLRPDQGHRNLAGHRRRGRSGSGGRLVSCPFQGSGGPRNYGDAKETAGMRGRCRTGFTGLAAAGPDRWRALDSGVQRCGCIVPGGRRHWFPGPGDRHIEGPANTASRPRKGISQCLSRRHGRSGRWTVSSLGGRIGFGSRSGSRCWKYHVGGWNHAERAAAAAIAAIAVIRRTPRQRHGIFGGCVPLHRWGEESCSTRRERLRRPGRLRKGQGHSESKPWRAGHFPERC